MAASSSETSVSIYYTARGHIPQDHYLDMPWHLNHDLKVQNSTGRNFGIIPDTAVYLQMFQR
jgi:hypothetical protein